MLVCVKLENRGLTSAALKKAMATTVVTKSKNPIIIVGKKNSALLFVGFSNLVNLQW